jgi:hypothetical protein
MRKLYGDSLRKDAGFTKVVKKVARRNARLLEKHAGHRAPEIKRVVQEVRGTFEKVYDDTAEALEGLLNKCMLFSLSPVSTLLRALIRPQLGQGYLRSYRKLKLSFSSRARGLSSRE